MASSATILSSLHPVLFRAVSTAADRLPAWIGIRPPNPLMNRWVFNTQYACRPKPLSCKAQTADATGHRLGGLVVDPGIMVPAEVTRGAFSSEERMRKARKSLEGLLAAGGGYSVEQDRNKLYGAVKLHGKYVYSDIDLYAVAAVDEKTGRLAPGGKMSEAALVTHAGQPQYLSPRVAAAQALINLLAGNIEIVQHGSDFDDREGARHDERLFWFGPRGQFEVWPGSAKPAGSTVPGPGPVLH